MKSDFKIELLNPITWDIEAIKKSLLERPNLTPSQYMEIISANSGHELFHVMDKIRKNDNINSD